MKKLLFALLAIALLLIAGFYFLRPAKELLHNTPIAAHPTAVYRCLTEKKLVQEWWLQNKNTVTTTASGALSFQDAGFSYTLTPRAFNVVDVLVRDGANAVQSYITLIPLHGDTTDASWKADLAANNGFQNIGHTVRNRKLQQEMAAALQRLQTFMQNDRNLYGFAVKQAQVTDTLLVVTKQQDTVLPTPERYYGLIKKLRSYIAEHGVQETNYPMLNISQIKAGTYQTMVALPIGKPVPPSGAILLKRMIPGAILIAEVKGGAGTVTEGMHQLDSYVREHSFTQPGLPFQSLVTDRLAEPDTLKWITKLYYPIE